MPNNAQGRYWLLTIPGNDWQPPTVLPAGINYLVGQKEKGASGYEHWQLLVLFDKNKRLAAVKSAFTSTTHAELSRSSAADSYVQKDDTAIEGTRFLLGERPRKLNSKVDWEKTLESAKQGDFDNINPGVLIRNYGNLVRIRADNLKPVAMVRTVNVFWGESGTGKTRLAYEQAGLDAYPKIPSTVWWDGYKGQENVIIDEFCGRIHHDQLLRWIDRYPVYLEIKHAYHPLMAKNYWITSNLPPEEWYPDIHPRQKAALMRRLTNVVHFDGLGNPPYVSPFTEPVVESRSVDDILNEIFST